MAASTRAMQRTDLDARLRALDHLATEAGAEALAAEARDVAGRVAEGRFYVACVGLFKRGKSTLLNALVGRSVLPTGVIPITSAVTVLRYAPEPTARVWFDHGREHVISPEGIAAYVCEAENPDNRKAVRAVEVLLPSPLLERGMCLVDTPGLGSVHEGNTVVTRSFVPHIDAALVVLGADPPLSGDELRLVEDIAGEVRTLLFVLNKADRLTPEERSEGARYAAQILSRSLRRPIGTAELDAAVRALHVSRAALRREAFRAAAEVARRSSDRFRAELEPFAAGTSRKSTERFVALADEFLARPRAGDARRGERARACRGAPRRR